MATREEKMEAALRRMVSLYESEHEVPGAVWARPQWLQEALAPAPASPTAPVECPDCGHQPGDPLTVSALRAQLGARQADAERLEREVKEEAEKGCVWVTERDRAVDELERLRAELHAAVDGKTTAWYAVWDKLASVGLMSFVGGNGTGLGRALAFIDQLVFERNQERTLNQRLALELVQAQAESAAMREHAIVIRRGCVGDPGVACHFCDAWAFLERGLLHKDDCPTNGTAGRALLDRHAAELRAKDEEIAQLTGRCQRLLDQQNDFTEEWMEERRRSRAALGRAVAALAVPMMEHATAAWIREREAILDDTRDKAAGEAWAAMQALPDNMERMAFAAFHCCNAERKKAFDKAADMVRKALAAVDARRGGG